MYRVYGVEKKNKKAVINQTAVLNFVEIKKNPQTVSNIKAFINKYNCYRIKYPWKIDDWKTFEKNNPRIAPNVSCTKIMEICPAYISETNLNCKRQMII